MQASRVKGELRNRPERTTMFLSQGQNLAHDVASVSGSSPALTAPHTELSLQNLKRKEGKTQAPGLPGQASLFILY